LSYAHSQLDTYRKNAVETASPLQLVVMLYDGALRFMDAGRRAMVAGNRWEKNQNLQRAQRILAELMSSLDMDKGEEVAKNLFALYSFCYSRLVEANLEDDTNLIDQPIRVLTELRDSWSKVEAGLRQQQSEAQDAA
jgi:flagellar secretion chaperone FliS